MPRTHQTQTQQEFDADLEYLRGLVGKIFEAIGVFLEECTVPLGDGTTDRRTIRHCEFDWSAPVDETVYPYPSSLPYPPSLPYPLYQGEQ